MLSGDRRRLATLPSLGVHRHDQIDHELGSVIVDECAAYFHRQPYLRWFRPLDRILQAGAGASYFDASACHLDLVQWATSPVWGRLDGAARELLLAADEPFLVRQLRQEHYQLVIVNGRAVMNWVEQVGLARWRQAGRLEGSPPCELFVSNVEGVQLLGWSSNLQSQPGAARHQEALASFVSEHAAAANQGGPTVEDRPATATGAPRSSSGDGDHIPRGTRFASVGVLVRELEVWLQRSHAAQLGDTGTTGVSAWLRVETPLGVMNLNADTPATPSRRSCAPPATSPSCGCG